MAKNQVSITASKREQRKLERLAKDAGLSLSNYLRFLLSLPVMKHGGPRKKAEQTEERCRKNKT